MAKASLRCLLAEKTTEVDALQGQVQRVRHEVEQLHSQLLAANVTDGGSVLPQEICAGTGLQTADRGTIGYRRLLEWLADHTNDGTPGQALHVSAGVFVNGHPVVLGDMVQFDLTNAAPAGLKLTVPWGRRMEVGLLLSRARTGSLGDCVELDRFAAEWDMMSAQVGAQPGIFLVHKATSQAAIVATWPQVEVPPVAPLDPAAFFARAVRGRSGARGSGDGDEGALACTAEEDQAAQVAFAHSAASGDDGLGRPPLPAGRSVLRTTRTGGLQWQADGDEATCRAVDELGIYFGSDPEHCRISGPFGEVVLDSSDAAEAAAALVAPRKKREAFDAQGEAPCKEALRLLVAQMVALAVERGVPVRCIGACEGLASDVSSDVDDSLRVAPQIEAEAVEVVARVVDTELPLEPSSDTTVLLHSVAAGDPVEVKWQGQWFTGVLHGVSSTGDLVAVRCDVDQPGVITMAPLRNVRRRPAMPRLEKQRSRGTLSSQ